MKKTTRTFLFMGIITLVACLSAACGGGNSSSDAAEAAAALPTDGILGELPKAVAEYEAKEAAADAKYEELKKTDADKANEFWKEHIQQGLTTKFKKETLPALSKAIEGKEIPGEVAEGLPLKLDKNFVLDDKRNATTSGKFTADASKNTLSVDYVSVAFDTEGKPIAIGKSINVSNYVVAPDKEFSARFFISIDDYDAAGWAQLQKIVIMDKKTDAFKQAEETIKATKKAFKEKGETKE